MPFLGLGLHLLVALFFAVHAVRSRRELYWLLILFWFPLLGSLVYFFAIYLPESRLERTIGKVGQTVRNTLDPGRALRDAQQEFDLAPTAHNQTKLANAMLDAGMFKEAVEQFDACLRGPFAGDAAIIFAAGRARLAYGKPAEAIGMLEGLRNKQPGYRPEQLSLTLAKAYSAANMNDRARAEFADVVERFSGIEARVEYALWAIKHNERAVVEPQLKELNHSRKHMNKNTRSMYQELFKRLDAAVKLERSS